MRHAANRGKERGERLSQARIPLSVRKIPGVWLIPSSASHQCSVRSIRHLFNVELTLRRDVSPTIYGKRSVPSVWDPKGLERECHGNDLVVDTGPKWQASP